MTSTPDGSSPRGYGRILVVEHRLKTLHISEVLLLPELEAFPLLIMTSVLTKMIILSNSLTEMLT
jgi:hypothetical protein